MIGQFWQDLAEITKEGKVQWYLDHNYQGKPIVIRGKCEMGEVCPLTAVAWFRHETWYDMSEVQKAGILLELSGDESDQIATSADSTFHWNNETRQKLLEICQPEGKE